MSALTSIEWTDRTWNPVRGCSRVSEGCRNCYAERVAARFSGPGLPYEGLADPKRRGSKWTGAVRLIDSALEEPLRWRKPSRVFVNSMSDLFHEELTAEDVARVFWTMERAPWHTFQVLTKRPRRMMAFARHVAECIRVLPNVWLGVSVEDQRAADERIPLLLETPAAVRFLSVEPLLGPVDLGMTHFGRRLPHLVDWVIVGGESGPGARVCSTDWIRSVVEQCRAAGVPVFVKQLGARPAGDVGVGYIRDRKGGDPDEWPEDLRVREFPEVQP